MNYIPVTILIPETKINLNAMLRDLHRFVVHITRVDLDNTREKVRTLGDFEDLRCHYILQLIDKETFAKTIYKNNGLYKKFTEMLHIYEILSVVGTELFAKLITVNASDKISNNKKFIEDALNHVGEYNKLREYCNEQFRKISLSYHQTVPFINEVFEIKSTKY